MQLSSLIRQRDSRATQPPNLGSARVPLATLSRRSRMVAREMLIWYRRTVVAEDRDYFEFALDSARRASVVFIAMAPSLIMAPIGAAASCGSTSAVHTTRLPPTSRG